MLHYRDQINVVLVGNVCAMSIICQSRFFWSIHGIYVVQRGCRQIFETAMQLIYCKCRCVSFWIYIFLNSFSKVETKVDLSIIYVDACWNISNALSAAWIWFFHLNLKHLNIYSEIQISLWWDKNRQWLVLSFSFCCIQVCFSLIQWFLIFLTSFGISESFIWFSKTGTMWTTNSVKTLQLMMVCFCHTSMKYVWSPLS